MAAILHSPKNRSFWAGKRYRRNAADDTIAQIGANRQARLKEKKRKEDAKGRRS